VETWGPRKRKWDQRWDYCCFNEDQNWANPIGYCSGNGPTPFHGDGHASREEAIACFRRYELDHEATYEMEHPDELRRCRICQAWTNMAAAVGRAGIIRIYDLCPAHQRREFLEILEKMRNGMCSADAVN
jgi:hypothetical protein